MYQYLIRKLYIFVRGLLQQNTFILPNFFARGVYKSIVRYKVKGKAIPVQTERVPGV